MGGGLEEIFPGRVGTLPSSPETFSGLGGDGVGVEENSHGRLGEWALSQSVTKHFRGWWDGLGFWGEISWAIGRVDTPRAATKHFRGWLVLFLGELS